MNSLAVAITIILFPGLIACVICDKITVHSPRWDAYKYSMYSFLFGILCYCALQLIYYNTYMVYQYIYDVTDVRFSSLDVWLIINNEKAKVVLSEVVNATLLAPLVALMSSFVVNYKVFNKIASKINVTQKYGDENLFSFFLNSKEVDWVYVRDKDIGLTYFGRVVSHSECESIQEIVLSEVSVHEYLTSELLYSTPVIYLSRPLGSFMIELPSPTTMEDSNGEKTA